MASYVEVLCECGLLISAQGVLDSEFDSQLTLPGRRLELVRGHVYLMGALHFFVNCGRLDEKNERSILEAKAIYTHHRKTLSPSELNTITKTNKASLYLACSGLAMAEHVMGLAKVEQPGISTSVRSDHLSAARTHWQEAHKIAKESWTELEYSKAITLYSMSEVAYELGLDEYRSLREDARRQLSAVGLRFWSVGQGTVWPRILAQRSQSQGRASLVSV